MSVLLHILSADNKREQQQHKTLCKIRLSIHPSDHLSIFLSIHACMPACMYVDIDPMEGERCHNRFKCISICRSDVIY